MINKKDNNEKETKLSICRNKLVIKSLENGGLLRYDKHKDNYIYTPEEVSDGRI